MTRIVAALILFVSIISNQNAIAGVDHVIVISVDGGKPAALLKSKMPHLQTLVTEGAATFSALTIQPSKTLPSHVSMLTGVSPNVHKVTWNSWNPLKGPVKVPTAFGLAKKLRLSTALFATKDKFKHLEVSGTLDKFYLGKGDA
ncbi:MAG: alkaline phosphatase family protein, partial [Bdellovibrionales bacterium]|nr:alkaline phosphatase family protein [Bdellovibrionales bacterium]